MPVAMERRLKAISKKRGYGKKRAGAFVYGTMRKTGWKPKRRNKRTITGIYKSMKRRS